MEIRIYDYHEAEKLTKYTCVEMEQMSLLRATSQRLHSTPVEELPRIAPYLASCLIRCSGPLQNAEDRASSSYVLVNRLKTRISSLLQDRSTEARFTAAVLIKAYVEAGDHYVLNSCSGWVRGILTCLNKPESPEVKSIYLLTITRIFLKAHTSPALQREVCTPFLPAFLTACLNLIKPTIFTQAGRSKNVSSSLLNQVLQCWRLLLPNYASLFRPFVSRIKPICLSLLEDVSTPHLTVQLAISIFSSLHLCVPKNGTSTEWTQSCSNTIEAFHYTADKVFDLLIEDWSPSNNNHSRRTDLDGNKGVQVDSLGLRHWESTYHGISRLLRLVEIIGGHLDQRQPQLTTIPLGVLIDLTSRISAVTISTDTSESRSVTRFKPEATKDQKDELCAALPLLHIACGKLLKQLLFLFSQALMPLYSCIGNQLLDVFECQRWNDEVRAQIYSTLQQLFCLDGKSASQLDRDALLLLLKTCSRDLGAFFPPEGSMKEILQPNGMSAPNARGENVPHYEKGSKVFRSAWNLLPVIFEKLPSTLIPHSLRSELDGSAILLNHHTAMLASVLNPPRSQDGKTALPSVITFYTQSAADELPTEALLRPRMPIIRDTLSQTAEDSDAEPVESPKIAHHVEDSTTDTIPHHKLQNSFGLNPKPEIAPVLPIKLTPAVTEPSLDVGAGKRGYSSISDTREDTQAVELDNGEQNTKKQRVQDHLGIVRSQDGVQTLVQSEHVDYYSGQQLLTNTELEELLPITSNSVPAEQKAMPAPIDADEDSSDFEIPKIDAELDTSDEDDMEE